MVHRLTNIKGCVHMQLIYWCIIYIVAACMNVAYYTCRFYPLFLAIRIALRHWWYMQKLEGLRLWESWFHREHHWMHKIRWQTIYNHIVIAVCTINDGKVFFLLCLMNYNHVTILFYEYTFRLIFTVPPTPLPPYSHAHTYVTIYSCYTTFMTCNFIMY